MPAAAQGTGQAHASTVFPAVNTLFNALANHPDFEQASTGAPDAQRSAAAWRCRQPARQALAGGAPAARSAEGYGLSETTPGRPPATRPTADAFSGTIGLPLPGTEIEAARRRGHARCRAGQRRRDRDPRARR
ncbi:MAG: hypothetical protein MZW92_04415 [Comamonadaceae bacterium]|nr:hypothetical protein [Comamonadaceae bacterium]